MMSGRLDDKNIKNDDETSFIINVDDGQTLKFAEYEFKYADTMSGREGLTMLVSLTCGLGSITVHHLLF